MNIMQYKPKAVFVKFKYREMSFRLHLSVFYLTKLDLCRVQCITIFHHYSFTSTVSDSYQYIL
jgi:hypothetical protein